jgi:DNA-binding GntR family transcriptional regulator
MREPSEPARNLTPPAPADRCQAGAAGDPPAVLDWLLCGNRQGLISLDPLPVESELRSILSTPRETVRRMLRQLAVYGLAKRLRSVGTSVPGSAAQALGYSGHASADQYRVIAVEHVHGNQVSRALFGAHGRHLVRVERLTFWGSGSPSTYSSFYFPRRVYEEQMATADWDSPSIRLISQASDEPMRIHYDMTAVALDERIADLLEVVPGSPALHIQRLFSTSAGNVAISFSRQPGVRMTYSTSMDREPLGRRR